MNDEQNHKATDAFQSKNYSFINHKDCEAFPCHDTIDREDFNCLFCYCPLYFTDENCGGSFAYTKKGVKDCSHCIFPHERVNYESVVDKLVRAIEARQKINNHNCRR